MSGKENGGDLRPWTRIITVKGIRPISFNPENEGVLVDEVDITSDKGDVYRLCSRSTVETPGLSKVVSGARLRLQFTTQVTGVQILAPKEKGKSSSGK